MQRQTLTNDVPPPVHSSTAPCLKRVIFHRSFLISLLAFTLLTMLSFALNIAGLKDNALGRRKPFHPESIAVLPFENFSGDSQQEYLVDGITDALITDLGRLSALRVLSRRDTKP